MLVAKSCPTLCDPMDCSPSGSFVHRILQAKILEWVAIPFSRESSWPRDQTHVSCIGRWILYCWATREAQIHDYVSAYVGFPGGSVVKNPPAKQETWVQSLGQEGPLEKEVATHSRIFAWEIPWTEEPGRLQSMWSQRVGHDWVTEHIHIHP